MNIIVAIINSKLLINNNLFLLYLSAITPKGISNINLTKKSYSNKTNILAR